MVQSAGNKRIKPLNEVVNIDNNILELQVGSSETIRENTYYLFKKSYNNYYNKKIDIDEDWLNWLIGFVEGDGAILGYKDRLSLVITQKDIKVLEEIKEKLGMGYINYYIYNEKNQLKSSKELKKDSKKLVYGRYIINDINNIFLMYLIFNGNLYLKNRKLQLKVWYEYLKKSKDLNLKNLGIDSVPELKENKKKISLENSWLQGFTDAEGCFSIKIFKLHGKDYVKIIYILDQKNEPEILNEISMLFCNKNLARLRKTKNNNMYRIEVLCNDINKDIHNKIKDYFLKYKLKTTKRKSFNIWIETMNIILGNQPLDEKKIKYIRKLRNSLNKYNINNKSIGHSNK